ncbi:MAG TPA: hypothetical protein VE934_11930 [Polaromonas sp.]|uniref:hypothetical protein n=1 Tax=Polaromonas sp. TaxID=1869339 RepID=UPI002D4F7090|nr:hypothetical protein [Polaromonas sp.]HYW57664.1 hypothetical protein [Polaromonas sp.]
MPDQPCLELAHFRFECRMLSTLLAVAVMFNMIDPALLVLNEPRALVAMVAKLTGNPRVLAVAFLFLALLVVPYVLMQLVCPQSTRHRGIVKIACLGMCVGGVLWIYLAFLSRNLDYETLTSIYARNGAWSICVGALLAFHLNNKQRRALEGAQ